MPDGKKFATGVDSVHDGLAATKQRRLAMLIGSPNKHQKLLVVPTMRPTIGPHSRPIVNVRVVPDESLKEAAIYWSRAPSFSMAAVSSSLEANGCRNAAAGVATA